MSETLGQRIRRLRQARGWTQSALARQAGLSQQMVSFVETNTRGLSVAHFAALAHALGVSLDALWTGERWDREAGA